MIYHFEAMKADQTLKHFLENLRGEQIFELLLILLTLY